MAELSAAFVRASLTEIDSEIERALRSVGIALKLDRCMVGLDPGRFGAFTHGWAREAFLTQQLKALEGTAAQAFPWLREKLLSGETVVMSSIDDIPDTAAEDKRNLKKYGPKSNVVVPVRVNGNVVAFVAFATLYRERHWHSETVRQLIRLAEIFGFAFERKLSTNEIVRLRQELNHVSRVNAMGELAASVAHELNQPLAAILSNAEAVQTMIETESPEIDEVKAAIADIVEDSNRAGETIRNLRSLFRRDDLRKTNLNLGDVVREVARLVRSDALVRDISFRLEVQESPRILGDKIQLQQVIVNLILNAFDAVSERDQGFREVLLEVPPAERGFARIIVRDSGAGISEQQISRIFDPFFTTKAGGMGMGLAISRSLVEAHGGKIQVASAHARGSTFEVQLPSNSDAGPQI